MYLSFFGLNEKPFAITPDPRYLYLSERHAEALAHLLYGINEAGGFVQLTGEVGTGKTTIVRSLKEFAHPDPKEKTRVDLNHAIRSTLTIARNEYKYVADLETDLAPLPTVLCHAGDVNQAVLNLVVNAAHAIADAVKGSSRRGRIRVRTRVEGDAVVIAVEDDGTGIPDAVRDRIFEPFFTTKEVGRGTGQGLAIARAVVVGKHGGAITFETEPGKGTTFFVRLPVDGAGRGLEGALP